MICVARRMKHTSQLTLAVSIFAASCGDPAGPAPSKASGSAVALGSSANPPKKGIIDRDLLAAFAPLPTKAENAKNPSTPDKVALGRQLYFETRLSKNHDVSCNSCHDLANWGVDGKPVSEGHRKQKGGRNSPTVYGAALHNVQFWDGRAADVEEQATGPIQNPVEMASDEKTVVETLSSIPEYVEAFKKAFPEDKEPISLANVGRAIGAFERTLLIGGRWDKYLGGDDTALTEPEKIGLSTFLDTGCQACHSGPMLGASMFQKLGAVKPWPDSKDQGKYEVTKKDEDKLMFKVPSLRNIAKTAPYFHDGGTADLTEAVRKMALHQTGKELSEDDRKAIATFLDALTVEIPAELKKAPELPKSTDKTPKPNPT